MCDNQIVFKENSLPLDDFIRLKLQAFGGTCPRNTALASLKGSIYVLHAEIAGEIIAMSRVVGDGGFVHYIADVIVVPEHQGKGLGREIMNRTLHYIRHKMENGDRTTVCLFAAKSKEGFYEKFGFAARPDETLGAGMQLWLKETND